MEQCDNPDCLICYPLFTKSGRMLTLEDLEKLAPEAEE